MNNIWANTTTGKAPRGLLFIIFSLFFSHAVAQTDPVIMTVNGQPVLRSEFEYSYNKNNSEGVIDKKSVEEYVDLFVNYKLKVAAAIDAHYDTLTSFKKEFAQYRDQQVLPMLVTDADMEAEAHKIYDETVERIGPDGLIKTAHILIRADQQAPQEEWDKAKVRIDSIYKALKGGADFADLATRLSQDPGSARQGGELPFVQHGQFVKEYEDVAFKLQPGEMSEVVKSPFGYHIILMKERKMLEPFEEHHDAILNFMEQRNMRDQIAQQKVDENKVQAALARAELRDIAQERRRELQDRVLERRKERDEYRRKLEETLHKQLTSGRVFGPRRLLRAFPDSKHMRYGELWKLLSEEINGEEE